MLFQNSAEAASQLASAFPADSGSANVTWPEVIDRVRRFLNTECFTVINRLFRGRPSILGTPLRDCGPHLLYFRIPMHPLTQLTCGDACHGQIGEITGHLARTLDFLLTRSKALRDHGADADLSIFGPFLGRATLEVASTAITARFDPYRVLAIRKSQLSTSYAADVRNPMAFNWSGDVQGVEKGKEWEKRPAPNDLQRALLCRHFNDLFWEEAFALMIDDVPFHRGNNWMRRLKRVDPEGFWNYMRATADKIYSELSKGIHHEFVVPISIKFDRVTVEVLLGRTWELIGALGVTTCYSPAIKPKNSGCPIHLFEEAQEELTK